MDIGKFTHELSQALELAEAGRGGGGEKTERGGKQDALDFPVEADTSIWASFCREPLLPPHHEARAVSYVFTICEAIQRARSALEHSLGALHKPSRCPAFGPGHQQCLA